MRRQLDLGKDLRAQADLVAVDQHHALADHPRLLEHVDPAPAGRLRQADPLRQLAA